MEAEPSSPVSMPFEIEAAYPVQAMNRSQLFPTNEGEQAFCKSPYHTVAIMRNVGWRGLFVFQSRDRRGLTGKLDKSQPIRAPAAAAGETSIRRAD